MPTRSSEMEKEADVAKLRIAAVDVAVGCRLCENPVRGSVAPRKKRFFVIFALCAITGLEISAALTSPPTFHTACSRRRPFLPVSFLRTA